VGEPPIVRHYPVGTSVEALASSWARREQAPHGAVVVLDNEVSGRLRGGEPWNGGDAGCLMVAMVSRPDIDPLQEALLWVPASLAAADGLAAVTGRSHDVLWPDRVIDGHADTRRCAVNVLVQLGPGRVDHAVFATRVDLRTSSEDEQGRLQKEVFVPAYVASARRYLDALARDPDALLVEYASRCIHIGNRVQAELLPRGEARGRATEVDRDGFLVLESPTGMVERIAPASLRSVEIVPESS